MMKKRLLKEMRVMQWPWLLSLAAVPVSILLFKEPAYSSALAFGLQMFAALVMGSMVFGREFGDKTMERLLSLPGGRRRLWGEKMLALMLCVGSCLFVFAVVFLYLLNLEEFLRSLQRILMLFGMNWNESKEFTLHAYQFRQPTLLGLLGLVGCLYFSAVFTGPLMALYLRSTLTAFWASIVTIGMILVVWPFLGMPVYLFFIGLEPIYLNEIRPHLLYYLYGFPLGVWCVVSYFLARRKLILLEV